MELRRLTTEAERSAFKQGLSAARVRNEAGFRETRRSAIGEIHLEFGRLYGLFDESGPEPDEMLAGIVMHDTSVFGLSYSVPDLRHLPAETVFEVGELWSRAKGAGLLARVGMVITLGLCQARAAVGYPIAKPWDLTGAYTRDFFTFVGKPVVWPWAETLDGGKVWVQPVVSEGARLRRMIHTAWAPGFQTLDRHRVIRFVNPYPFHPTLTKIAAADEVHAVAGSDGHPAAPSGSTTV